MNSGDVFVDTFIRAAAVPCFRDAGAAVTPGGRPSALPRVAIPSTPHRTPSDRRHAWIRAVGPLVAVAPAGLIHTTGL